MISKKLLLTDDKTILIRNAPASFLAALEGVTYATDIAAATTYTYIQIFAHNPAELHALLSEVMPVCAYDGILWACYPKGSSKLAGDIKRGTLFSAAEEFGVRPVTQVAIDATWSAMRLRPHDRVGT